MEMLSQLECGNNIDLKLNSCALVPILTKEEQTNIAVKQNDDDIVSIPINYSMHFNYFKMKKGNIKIYSDKELIIAKPVQLVHHKNNKKLVISVFVDGMCQEVLSEDCMENIMPNTYKFFKKGRIFKIFEYI